MVLVDLKGTSLILRQFKADDPNYYPFLLSELKTKFFQWKSEWGINPNNCPDQLKQILREVNEILEGNSESILKNQRNSKDLEETTKIITALKLEITELLKKYKLKNEDLGFQFRDWENQIKEKNGVSEIRSYQQKIKQVIQAKTKDGSTTTN